jgi:GNAT superfamily N-acetyltransferase
VTDVNISYKRRAIESTRSLWQNRYHETTVHWQLARDGETLWLTPDLVVWQRRRGLGIGKILRERVEWGRLFAYTRVREGSVARRVVYAVTSPLLPIVLFVRHTRMQVGKRVRLSPFVRAAPLVALFLAAWSWGELVGYVTGRP